MWLSKANGKNYHYNISTIVFVKQTEMNIKLY